MNMKKIAGRVKIEITAWERGWKRSGLVRKQYFFKRMFGFY